MKIMLMPPIHSFRPLANIKVWGTVMPSISVSPVVEEADIDSNQLFSSCSKMFPWKMFRLMYGMQFIKVTNM